MKQYIDKAAVVEEIERRKQTWQHQDQRYVNGGKDVCDYLLGFIDTLEMKEEPISEDLEEAATKYARKQVANPDYPTYNDECELECAFEAGAQWQKERIINKACEWMKSYRQDTPDGTGYVAGIVDDKTIKEFKQAMEK